MWFFYRQSNWGRLSFISDIGAYGLEWRNQNLTWTDFKGKIPLLWPAYCTGLTTIYTVMHNYKDMKKLIVRPFSEVCCFTAAQKGEKNIRKNKKKDAGRQN